MPSNRKPKVVFENDFIRVSTLRRNGKHEPPKVSIVAKKEVGRKGTETTRGHIWAHRQIDLTIDEMFDLTEALDDLCDYIEDNRKGGVMATVVKTETIQKVTIEFTAQELEALSKELERLPEQGKLSGAAYFIIDYVAHAL